MARFYAGAPTVQAGEPATSLQVNISGVFYGADVPGGTSDFATSALVLYSDSGAQADTKIQTAITDAATARGLTLAGGYKVALTKV